MRHPTADAHDQHGGREERRLTITASPGPRASGKPNLLTSETDVALTGGVVARAFEAVLISRGTAWDTPWLMRMISTVAVAGKCAG